MQLGRTFLFIFMHCKVQRVFFCHSAGVPVWLGVMMMSRAYPLFTLIKVKIDSPINMFFDLNLKNRPAQSSRAYLSAAWQMVPHVSAMSSTRMATRSVTSPTSTMRSTSLAFFRSLWMRAKSTLSRSAMDVTLCDVTGSGMARERQMERRYEWKD